jgi:ElaB/YqjD/DUF883 family membrane-anchored ribosome-binding protein
MESGEKTPNPDEIQREIDQTREELGETVEAVARKADVKGRAKKKAVETQETLKAKVGDVQETVSEAATPERARQTAVQAAESIRERPGPAIAVAALAGGLLVVWVLARR